MLERLLAELRLEGGRYACSDLGAPWALAWKAREGAMYHYVARGGAWLHDNGVSSRLERGDLLVLPRASGHVLSAGRDVPRGLPEVDFTDQGTAAVVRRGGAGPRTLLVCGELLLRSASHPLCLALPDRIHLRLGRSTRGRWIATSLALLESEALGDRLGARAIAARLAEVIFIEAVRHAHLDGQAPRGLLAGLSDPVLRDVITALHGPGAPPTLAELARRAGVSRSVLAARFHEVVGEPPIAYATRVRVHAAAQRLRAQPSRSVAEIASDAGYASEAAFTRAFTRIVGTTPARHRRG